MSDISAVVFSPQNVAPTREHLDLIRASLNRHDTLSPLRDALLNLPKTWELFANIRLEIATLQQGKLYTNMFSKWIQSGETSELEQTRSGIVTLPLLTVLHIVQYYEYLQASGTRHAELLRTIKGGVQGYCIGLMAALVVATSENENDLINNATAAVRITLGIAAFGEIGCDPSNQCSTTMAIRLRKGTEGDETIRAFPQSYVSAISDTQSISITAHASVIPGVKTYITDLGLPVKMMHLQSNIHNPKNESLAEELILFCNNSTELQIPDSTYLQVPVRSNRTGKQINSGSLTGEIINTVLTACCDWNIVMTQLATDLRNTNRRCHKVAMIGVGDFLPLSSFQKNNLDITKIDTYSVINQFDGPTRGIRLSSQEDFPSDSIAIVGAACRLPGASTLDELWELLSKGESRVESLRESRIKIQESFRASQDRNWVNNREWLGNFIDNVEEFDHTFFGISPKEAVYMDPQQRLLLLTAFEAMDASGYLRHHRREDGDSIGCFIGASYTEYLENTAAYAPSAFTATGTIRAFISGKISYHFGWTGPSEVIDTACSASLVAIHHACRAIQAGDCPMALAGGVNLITGIQNYMDLGKASFLSKTGQCKPFDESADGYCRGDGVGLVVLKSLCEAIKNHDHIMGVIPATGTNQGSLSPGITVPHDKAQKALYRQVLQKSAIPSEKITYVEAHGTGTQVGDPIEIDSIREVFGGGHRSDMLTVGSLKGNVGHSETAAGVASLLKVLTMFSHRSIPPQVGFKQLNHKIPALELSNMRIASKLLPWEATPRIACVNGYGASGSNSALICSEWTVKHHKPPKTTTPYPVMLSAHSQESLVAYAEVLASYIQKSEGVLTLADISFTLSERRKHHKIRWSTTARDLPDLVQQLRSGINNVPEPPATRTGIVLTFSGQAKTNIGLDPLLCETYPKFREYIELCNSILQRNGYPSITPALYQVEPVSDVVVLQTGTFAVQYSCAKCWLDSGLKVDAVLGHSFGELTALTVSGVLSLEEGLRLVAKRASLMKTTWGFETGTMLAVHADIETVQRVLKLVVTGSSDQSLEIACHNSPNSHIIVGAKTSISKAQTVLQGGPQFYGLRSQLLDVSHGFHSTFTEPLLPHLSQYAETLTFKSPTIPLETCTQFPVDEIKPEYLAKHTRCPVYFVNAVRRLEERLGPCVWVEAGWNTPIIPMTKKALARPKEHHFQHLKESPATISSAIAFLFRNGVSASWWGFLSPDDSAFQHIWLPPYQFKGPRHWLTHIDRATEALNSQALRLSSDKRNNIHSPPKLAVYIGPADDNSHQFQINTSTQRYTRIVSGHAVLKQPLCPVSMYMEMAVMCAELNGFKFSGKTIGFQNLVFHSGLGCSNDRDVRLTLSEKNKRDSWKFSVHSSKKTNKPSSNVKHAEGEFDTNEPDFRLYEILISDRVDTLRNDPTAERFMTRTAYSLFSRIVEYNDILQGISSITLGCNQAVADIQVPDTAFDNNESSANHFMDAAAIDTFFQAAGLLINTSGGTTADEAFVAASVEKITLRPCDFHKQKKWTVYAIFLMTDESQASGDIFVFSEQKQLVALGLGVVFSKVRVKSLARLLKGVNTGERSVVETTLVSNRIPVVEISSHEEKTVPTVIPSTSMDNTNENHNAQRKQLKEVISGYTGISTTELCDEESFSSLGLDSLSVMALADELKDTFNIEISSDSLMTSDINTLLKFATCSEENMTNDDVSLPGAATPLSSTDDESSGWANTTVKGQNSKYLNRQLDVHESKGVNGTRQKSRGSTRHRVETVTYKEVDGVEIPADIFVPLEPPSQAMPIALLFHGGGYMTLSRKAVRPVQTQFLLANGILPISFDYRLCPQVNVIDGAISDARDAYAWAIRKLPALIVEKGAVVDPSKIVIVGWSTGGHLAMTLAWTTIVAGLPPPVAILAFYCPTFYDTSDESLRMGKEYPSRTMSMNEISRRLEATTATGHSFSSTDNTGLGWIKPGDPRSELVLALVQEKNGVALLLDGIPAHGNSLEAPDPLKVAKISPITQVNTGNYHTPTFLIIGDHDEIVPFHTAVNFAESLKEHGIHYGFIAVPGAKHIHDLTIYPGSTEWDNWVLPGYNFLFDMLDRQA
ncbi:uncharacterized protein TRUGW13939_00288 [Talaromyces rugulosus]|uniref:Uncharacterized protein n=1 Tax=Talaromyces rugulosus TaxID=121627 RepID=A0A7H8QHZ9_TALRU|nr:uncharacterized protein TRUGW13939_00288 [Talaromyces rugulosus]QKX53212.1 hypothetical protein TRUGW13939_00288 [Talaromyces rugulosus]